MFPVSFRIGLIAVMLAVMSTLPVAFPVLALEFEQRQELDLSAYRVRDTNAGYFDVDERRRYLATTRSPVLRAAIEEAASAVPSCASAKLIPKIDFKLRMPAYYADHEAWREAIRPLFAFEDAVSALAAAFVALGDEHHAHCLIEVLDEWAQADALSAFHYSSSDRQAWYNTEDMIFSAALAYSIVRGRVAGMEAMERRIDAWFNRISHNHIRIRGGTDSCCNNHFYRRALHATMVGILTSDDELFRFGVSAIYSAIAELTP
ncbi:MAG: alginate lyase family protein, partial [Geminicoccaceae bacterium]